MMTAEQVRKKMRISHSRTDDDISGNIEAARLDMARVGIDPGADDALVDKAVELYCKGQFDYLGKGEQFMQNYERLRDAMSMAEGYKCGTR
ncbi:hypothetical protein [Acetatifactor aquisgranensis]|uniref:hypothetical protein n=1 Tax=Acetatifactor aquisgranensis TaxID=2941233 RepID=UPI00203DF340|nr:hypothetical protein [Acetatifactor aquisgranensis]